jgi:polyisoprenoid-binding protein YceI
MTLSLLALLTSLSFAEDVPDAEPAAEEAPSEAPSTKTYQLDAGKSRLYVLVKYARDATIGGHDHIVSASTFDGTVVWNEADPSVCDIQISFPVSALTVDPGSSRSWEGLEGETGDGDKSKIQANLSGKHQLDAASFPTISFKSTSCSGSGSSVKVTGDLSMHGKSKSVTTTMNVSTTDGFAAKGSFTADHSSWGMEPFSALLGALRNAPELKFVVDVKGS